MRWQAINLTWDPTDWAGIHMVYISPDQIWRPDLLFSNQTNFEFVNNTMNDLNLVRVWASNAKTSDLLPYNVEYSPYVKFEVHHEFDLNFYPVDTQVIDIRIDSWMTIQN